MTDTEAIQRLMFLYAECVDQADFEGLERLFEHGVMRANTAVGGMTGAEVRKFYARTNKVHPNGTLCTRHLATNIIVDIEDGGDRASARSYFVVLQATDKLPFQPIAGGRYHDHFERVDGAWRFAERMVLVDQVGNMSDHLTFDLAKQTIDIQQVLSDNG